MKVSKLWLREWVNGSLAAETLGAMLTMAGLETDGIDPVAGEFHGVIVAQVMKTRPHPQADKLTLCDVDAGSGTHLQVVCGARNVRAGLKVALARIGAHLPGPLIIKEAKLRGELSQGMLCSLSELGLADASEGIMELESNAPLGMDFREYFALNDQVLTVELTPNRADCMSILGIAREISVLTSEPLKRVNIPENKPLIDECYPINVVATEACPRYCVRVIRGINPEAITPMWLSERLRRVGIRAIHPVVDVTNYVMMELGQPLHAFDADTLQAPIEVRFSKEAETLTLLDGQTVTLQKNTLLIADGQKALAMAGIMGGQDSAVQSATTNLLLESAYFAPIHLAGVARRHGLTTEASQRFERGVDPGLQRLALERATQLLLEIVGGQAGPLSECIYTETMPRQEVISFDPACVKKLTGLDIDSSRMLAHLRGLGMLVDTTQPVWQVTAPTHRFDMHHSVDLVEEILRLQGYDTIPSVPMQAQLIPGKTALLDDLTTRMLQFLSTRGYHETISYAFVDPALQETLDPLASPMALVNPLSPELSVMRTGLWSGLIASMVHNLHRQAASVRLMENAVTFHMKDGVLHEEPCFAGLLTGETGADNWIDPQVPLDFYAMKGDLQALFGALSLHTVEWLPDQHPALHPGKSARLRLNAEDIGWCGVLHPRIADALDISADVLLFELRPLRCLNAGRVQYQQVSRYPQIRRDLSLLVDKNVSFALIEQCVRQVPSHGWLKALTVFDVYVDATLSDAKKSLAVSLIFQDKAKTLIEPEINAVIDAIIEKLNQDLDITLRG